MTTRTDKLNFFFFVFYLAFYSYAANSQFLVYICVCMIGNLYVYLFVSGLVVIYL